MRSITNSELLVISGGEDGVTVYEDDLGGFPSVGDFGGGKSGGQSKPPAPQPPKCTETVTTVTKEQVVISVEVGLTGIKTTKSDGGTTTTVSRTCTGK